jgi:hypothetical protein
MYVPQALLHWHFEDFFLCAESLSSFHNLDENLNRFRFMIIASYTAFLLLCVKKNQVLGLGQV